MFCKIEALILTYNEQTHLLDLSFKIEGLEVNYSMPFAVLSSKCFDIYSTPSPIYLILHIFHISVMLPRLTLLSV